MKRLVTFLLFVCTWTVATAQTERFCIARQKKIDVKEVKGQWESYLIDVAIRSRG